MCDCNYTFKVFDVLRSKNFLILMLFVLATSISIWLVSVPTPNIRMIMTETGKHITNLKNMNVMQPQNPVPKEVTMSETYLELLGFSDNPSLYPVDTDESLHVPVVVTGVTSGTYQNAFRLIDSVQKYLPDKNVMIFDLGLGSYEAVALKKRCNETTSCTVRSFDFDKFPKHVKDMNIRAYKPIAIQEALNQFTAIIWTDDEQYFTTSDIAGPVEQARKEGITAWVLESMEPTSALTHPKMFEHFKTQPQKYWFQHMVGARHLVVYNTRRVHEELMRPWVQCALTTSCIFPRGAQSVGCNFKRKPKYKYSSCHRYDTSALNVILGKMFDFSEDLYVSKEVIFGVEPEPVEETTGENSTVKTTTTKGYGEEKEYDD